jgi:hypothetical protein
MPPLNEEAATGPSVAETWSGPWEASGLKERSPSQAARARTMVATAGARSRAILRESLNV